jgi:hypothetical protein
MKTISGLMKKISGWKAAWLAVAVVVLPLLAANVVRADSVSDKAATMDVLGVHIGMTPTEVKKDPFCDNGGRRMTACPAGCPNWAEGFVSGGRRLAENNLEGTAWSQCIEQRC